MTRGGVEWCEQRTCDAASARDERTKESDFCDRLAALCSEASARVHWRWSRTLIGSPLTSQAPSFALFSPFRSCQFLTPLTAKEAALDTCSVWKDTVARRRAHAASSTER